MLTGLLPLLPLVDDHLHDGRVAGVLLNEVVGDLSARVVRPTALVREPRLHLTHRDLGALGQRLLLFIGGVRVEHVAVKPIDEHFLGLVVQHFVLGSAFWSNAGSTSVGLLVLVLDRVVVAGDGQGVEGTHPLVGQPLADLRGCDVGLVTEDAHVVVRWVRVLHVAVVPVCEDARRVETLLSRLFVRGHHHGWEHHRHTSTVISWRNEVGCWACVAE